MNDKSTADFARSAQVEYGRWIVNTLWLMHSGAIAGLVTKWDGQGIPPHSPAMICFVIGIVLAFGTAVISWFNFSIAAGEFNLEPLSRQELQKYTMLAAIVLVFGSIICLIAGARLIL